MQTNFLIRILTGLPTNEKDRMRINHDELKRLLERRVGTLLTSAQLDYLTGRLIEIRHPCKRDLKELSQEPTGSCLLQESLREIDDIIAACTE